MPKRSSAANQQGHLFQHTVRLRYLLFLPQGYEAAVDKKWPLILFLHGMGERGDDLDLVKIHGIPKIVDSQPDFPFITLSPQCPDGTLWWHHNLTLKALLDEAIANHRVDPNRVYLTGLSMGGYGAWSLAIAFPDTFAAVAPICGGGLTEWVWILRKVPVWAFHGADDPIVPLQQGQRMVDALRAAGGDVKFTVYPGVGHDSWTQTYANPELYRWLLKHSR